jgi:hypothetical protein
MTYDLENNRLVENWPEPKPGMFTKQGDHPEGNTFPDRVIDTASYNRAVAAYNNRPFVKCSDETPKLWAGRNGEEIPEKEYETAWTCSCIMYNINDEGEGLTCDECKKPFRLIAYPLTKEAGDVHELKTWPEYFQAVKAGTKTFEIRKNDCDYKVSDILLLREWKPMGYSKVSPDFMTGEYTGDALKVKITYILPYEPHFGIPGHLSIMSFAPFPSSPGEGLKDVRGEDEISEGGKELIARLLLKYIGAPDKVKEFCHVMVMRGFRLVSVNKSGAPEDFYILSPQPAQPAGQGDSGIGVAAIAKERRRQIEIEKWDYSHDEHYKNGELIGAAACYAVNALNKLGIKSRVQIYLPAETNIEAGNTGDRGDRQLRKAGWYDAWPWDSSYDKREKHDVSRSLEISGALVAAAIDVLQPQAAARYHYPKASTPVDHYGEGLTELAKEIERQKEVITEQDQQLIKYRQTIDDLQSQLSLLQSREGKFTTGFAEWVHKKGWCCLEDQWYLAPDYDNKYSHADLFTQFLNETGKAK